MNTIKKAISFSNTALVFSMKTIIIAVITVATGTMFLQVITRYVFEISVSGLDELAGHTAVWLYMMGAAYGAYERSHIKANMLHIFIKNKKVLAVADALALAIAIVVSGFMVVWSYGYVEWSIRKHEITPTLQLPTVIFQVSIFIGAFLMLIYFFAEFISKVRPSSETDVESNYQVLSERK